MTISAENITKMALEPNEKGSPVLRVLECANHAHELLLTTGYGVHLANEFLRSLDLGIKIEFDSFSQYGMLIMECAEALRVKNGVIA